MNGIKIFISQGDNIINGINFGFGALGGVLAWFLGGFDTILIALTSLIVLDYLTGIIKAIYLKKLSSSIGYKGIIKKIMMFSIVGMTVLIQSIMPDSIPLREITITFFICNEGLSILENASAIIPIPDKIKNVLLQLRKANDEKADKTTTKQKDK